jgi:hypothetical protein
MEILFKNLKNQFLVKFILLNFILFLSLINIANGQTKTDSINKQSSLRISLLTCGSGEDLYSVYGHSAIRVVDSSAMTDIVYNYGTFNFSDPDFYLKFTRGKLLYYVNDESFDDFMNMYMQDGRSVYEQVLNLNPADANVVNEFLLNNLKEENKYYKYDFLFDNCSTRLKDIFTKSFGKRFQLGHIIADDSMSFRTVLNYYERNIHWERFGINLLLSNQVDNKMTNEQSTFLPDYLMRAIAVSTIDGSSIVKETMQLLPEKNNRNAATNEPKLYGWFLLLGVLLISFSSMKKHLIYFDVLFFLMLGLLGFVMLFMWFGTEHSVCAWNRNLLWAFPLHIVFAFLIPRESTQKLLYAKYTSMLLVVSMFYSLFAQQEYIAEITPILILILYRLSKYSKPTMNNMAFKNFF